MTGAPKKKIIWNYYHPGYWKELLSRPHWKTINTFFAEDMSRVDISTLFRDGCIGAIYYEKGRLRFSISLEGLLASNNLERLEKSIRRYYDNKHGRFFPIQEVIKPFILYGDKKKSLQKFKEYQRGGDEFHMVSYLFGCNPW